MSEADECSDITPTNRELPRNPSPAIGLLSSFSLQEYNVKLKWANCSKYDTYNAVPYLTAYLYQYCTSKQMVLKTYSFISSFIYLKGCNCCTPGGVQLLLVCAIAQLHSGVQLLLVCATIQQVVGSSILSVPLYSRWRVASTCLCHCTAGGGQLLSVPLYSRWLVATCLCHCTAGCW